MNSNEAVEFIESNKKDGKKRLVLTYDPSTAEITVAGPIFDAVLCDGMIKAGQQQVEAARAMRAMQAQSKIIPSITLPPRTN